jgi:hypothetical protein
MKMDIKAINKELARIGYKAVKLPKPKNAALSWKPQTQAGRACRAAMLYWASLPPIMGVTKAEIRNPMCFGGEWIDVQSPLSVVVKAVPRLPLLAQSSDPTPRRAFGRAGLLAYLRDKLSDNGWQTLSYIQLDPAKRYAIANSIEA